MALLDGTKLFHRPSRNLVLQESCYFVGCRKHAPKVSHSYIFLYSLIFQKHNRKFGSHSVCLNLNSKEFHCFQCNDTIPDGGPRVLAFVCFCFYFMSWITQEKLSPQRIRNIIWKDVSQSTRFEYFYAFTPFWFMIKPGGGSQGVKVKTKKHCQAPMMKKKLGLSSFGGNLAQTYFNRCYVCLFKT